MQLFLERPSQGMRGEAGASGRQDVIIFSCILLKEGIVDITHLRIFKNLFSQLKSQKMKEYEKVLTLGIEKTDHYDHGIDEKSKVLALKLKSRTSFYLKKIEQALERLDEGVFGICEECEESISKDRLFARPTAHLCIKCKESEELEERQIPYSRKSHTLGKGLITGVFKELPSISAS